MAGKRRRSGPCVYWRSGRAWANLASFADVLPRGKTREPLKAEGEKLATTDKDLAAQLLGARIEQLREARLRRQVTGSPVKWTLRDLHEDYKKALAQAPDAEITDDWIAKVEKYLDTAVEFFDERDIQTIEPPDVWDWLNWLRDTKTGRRGSGLSGATLRHYFYALSGMFDHAVFRGLLPKGNPAVRVDKKRRPRVDTPKQPWLEPHESALFLEAARLLKRRPGTAPMAYPFVYPVVATFLLTGGRKAEVLGLAVNDVDFSADCVRFRPHPWRRLKNDGSIRNVRLWPQLAAILRDYLGGPDAPKGHLLFPGADEHMIVDLRKTLDTLAELCGWPKATVSPKAFRHAYASARVHTVGGDAIFNVAHEMGHNSLAMISRVYAHYFAHRRDDEITRQPMLEYRVERYEKQELKEALPKMRERAREMRGLVAV